MKLSGFRSERLVATVLNRPRKRGNSKVALPQPVTHNLRVPTPGSKP